MTFSSHWDKLLDSQHFERLCITHGFETNDVEVSTTDKEKNAVRDSCFYVERAPYKRSDPIDIVYPKATW
ncbi:hypothetical protein DICVIV_13541 [Dictyocaulus viviparus]|uniref:Uncharacterized protein n=1 Tax=Dictyocaulus viviparus TaxID=29172 RepID=A0A0D8X9Q2_DICVI|nr:hypothetical protein DICVIV_13541 [Dictyocaulus viviparus]